MATDWRGVVISVVASVGTAAVLGAFALLGSWGFGGGLIHMLGGVTAEQFKEHDVPGGAVVAFRHSCPADGWHPYEKAKSRVIVGAENDLEADETHETNLVPGEIIRPASDAKPDPPPPFRRRVEVSVSGAEHEHLFMPPFVSLVYCEKNYKR